MYDFNVWNSDLLEKRFIAANEVLIQPSPCLSFFQCHLFDFLWGLFAYLSFKVLSHQRMALVDGNGHMIKAFSQPLDTISLLEEEVWRTNVRDSSECIDFIHHSRQLFELLLKVCLSTMCHFCSIERLIFIEASDLHIFMLTTHRMTSAWGLKIGCQLYSRCWYVCKSSNALLKIWKKKNPWKVQVMSVLITSHRKWVYENR